IIWYLPRLRGGWQWVAGALIAFHVVIPFFLLLLRDVKRNPGSLARVAGLILFMQIVFMDYQVLPAFEDSGVPDQWLHFVMPFGIGGIWLAYFVWQVQQQPQVALH